MSYVVYWLKRYDGDGYHGPVTISHFREFGAAEMSEALAFTQEKRRETDVRHVSMSSEDPNQVGGMGVDSISADGHLPNGNKYDWKKRRL